MSVVIDSFQTEQMSRGMNASPSRQPSMNGHNVDVKLTALDRIIIAFHVDIVVLDDARCLLERSSWTRSLCAGGDVTLSASRRGVGAPSGGHQWRCASSRSNLISRKVHRCVLIPEQLSSSCGCG